MAPLAAPTRMIECVEAALLLPYDIGRGLEQSAFDDLIRSEHSKSLRHIFASERKLMAATNWEGRVMSRQLNAAAVVGATGLCAEVAVQCLDAGFDVTLVETSEQDMEKAVGRIIGHYDARIAAGTMSETDVEQVLDRMHAVPGYQSLSDADIVIDPSPSLTKRRVAALDGAMRAGAILLIAGERVAMDQVAALTGRETDVVGMRFFPNVKKNRLIELSASEKTGPRAIATARQLARKLDRLIVDVAPSREAIGTRLAEALHAAADLCMEDGASIEQIDAALRDWGLPHGSFAWRDLIGIHRPSAPGGTEGQRGGGIDPVLVSVGRVGMSVGKG
jgi:3-hydroxyacyl-CoA dehydrogenase